MCIIKSDLKELASGNAYLDRGYVGPCFAEVLILMCGSDAGRVRFFT